MLTNIREITKPDGIIVIVVPQFTREEDRIDWLSYIEQGGLKVVRSIDGTRENEPQLARLTKEGKQLKGKPVGFICKP